MTVSIHKIARALFADLVRLDMWDSPPILVVQGKGSNKATLCVLDLDGMNPATFLSEIAQGRHRDVLGDLSAGVSGLAVHSEGWALKGPTPEDIEWVREHSIADHPKGYEVKTIVSYDGKMFKSLILYRGDEEPTEEQGRKGALQGRVPSALSAAFEGLNAL